MSRGMSRAYEYTCICQYGLRVSLGGRGTSRLDHFSAQLFSTLYFSSSTRCKEPTAGGYARQGPDVNLDLAYDLYFTHFNTHAAHTCKKYPQNVSFLYSYMLYTPSQKQPPYARVLLRSAPHARPGIGPKQTAKIELMRSRPARRVSSHLSNRRRPSRYSQSPARGLQAVVPPRALPRRSRQPT